MESTAKVASPWVLTSTVPHPSDEKNRDSTSARRGTASSFGSSTPATLGSQAAKARYAPSPAA